LPAHALDEEGKTDDMKCLKISQPYGIGSAIRFWTNLQKAPRKPEKDGKGCELLRLYQAGFIGFQYFLLQLYEVLPNRSGIGFL